MTYTIQSTPLKRFMGVERFWENPEIEESMLGPVPVPWEMRKFYYNPRSGKFRRCHQDWMLTKKNHEIVDQGFVGKQYVVAPDGNASHVNGSPIITFEDMVSAFDLSEEDESTLGEAFLKLAESRPDWRMSNYFIEEVKNGAKTYSQSIADKFNEMYGLGPVNPLKELEALEAENKVLKARKRTKEIAEENAALRDEMVSEQVKAARAVKKALKEAEPEQDPADDLASEPRTRRRRRVKTD